MKSTSIRQEQKDHSGLFIIVIKQDFQIRVRSVRSIILTTFLNLEMLLCGHALRGCYIYMRLYGLNSERQAIEATVY